MNQTELAEKYNLTPAMVSMIYRGKRKTRNIKLAKNLEAITGVPYIDYLADNIAVKILKRQVKEELERQIKELWTKNSHVTSNKR